MKEDVALNPSLALHKSPYIPAGAYPYLLHRMQAWIIPYLLQPLQDFGCAYIHIPSFHIPGSRKVRLFQILLLRLHPVVSLPLPSVLKLPFV